MGEVVLRCNRLTELESQLDRLEGVSVLHFSLLMTAILTLGVMIVYRHYTHNKSLFHFIIVTSFIFYILNVIRLVFFPLPINQHYIELLKEGVNCGILTERRHNFQLFDFMKWDNLFHITTLGNFIMLMPLSFYLPILFTRLKWGIFKTILVGFFISLTIECLQLAYDLITGYAYRGFNVDDLLMNTLGVMVGYLLIEMIQMVYYLLSVIIIKGLKRFRV